MLMRIQPSESIDAHQGRKKQRVKAPPQRLRAVMYQGKIVARMRVLMGLYHLRALLHHRIKETLLVEPSGKQMHAHIRQPKGNVDDLCPTGHRPLAERPATASFTTIEPPGPPPPVAIPDPHSHGHSAPRILGA